jgi:serine/threonine protein kinase
MFDIYLQERKAFDKQMRHVCEACGKTIGKTSSYFQCTTCHGYLLCVGCAPMSRKFHNPHHELAQMQPESEIMNTVIMHPITPPTILERTLSFPRREILRTDRYQLTTLRYEDATCKIYNAKDIHREGKMVVFKMIPLRGQIAVDLETTVMNQIRKTQNEGVVEYVEAFLSNRNPENPDAVSDTKYLCVIMEHYTTDLVRILTLANGKFPRDIAYNYFLQLLQILRDMHEQQISHRNLKPENIFVICEEELSELVLNLDTLMRNAKLKIGDFYVTELARPSSSDARANIYACREAILGSDNPCSWDVYSLGIIFTQLLTGLSTDKFTTAMNKLTTSCSSLLETSTSVADVLSSAVERNLHSFVLSSMIDDHATRVVLSYMFDNANKRYTATALQTDTMVEAWRDALALKLVTVDKPWHIIPHISMIRCAERLDLVNVSLPRIKDAICDRNSTSFTEEERQCTNQFRGAGGINAIMRTSLALLSDHLQQQPTKIQVWSHVMSIVCKLLTLVGATSRHQLFELQNELLSEGFFTLVTQLLERKTSPTCVAYIYAIVPLMCRTNTPVQKRFASEVLKQIYTDLSDDKAAQEVKQKCKSALRAVFPGVNSQLFATVAQPFCGQIFSYMAHLEPFTRKKLTPAAIVTIVKALVKKSLTTKEESDELGLIHSLMIDHDKNIMACRVKGLCTSKGAPCLVGHSIPQWYCYCATCFQDDQGVCIQCAHTCHCGHRLELRYSEVEFLCACGNTCKCMNTQASILPHLQKSKTSNMFEMNRNGVANDAVEFQMNSTRALKCKQDRIQTMISDRPICRLSDAGPGITIAYVEITIHHGGLNDGIYVGACLGSHYTWSEYPGTRGTSIAFYCDTGEVRCSLDDMSWILPYAGPVGSECKIGIGITDQGAVYFTRNDHLMPLVPYFRFPIEGKPSIHFLLGLCGKDAFVHVNTGKYPFSFSHEGQATLLVDEIYKSSETLAVIKQENLIELLMDARFSGYESRDKILGLL